VKDTKIDVVLRSLWIDGVGKKTAKNLSVLFPNEDSFLNFSHELETIQAIPDIWPEVAQNLSNYFLDTNNKSILQELIELLEIEYYTVPDLWKDSFFAWKSVCITWTFELNWEKFSRDFLVQKLEHGWWNFTWSVSKKTDYLLAWEKAWSKLKKAQELWIEVLSIDDFFILLK
jgi:DNA ligase (NAD+)